mmetsp:Transcript_5861/g.14858  ORF Transcript_5861/g.14858 Transcript_5861/m.14858 type:complete len:253 (-) Transcript_5861:343-1101(-)
MAARASACSAFSCAHLACRAASFALSSWLADCSVLNLFSKSARARSASASLASSTCRASSARSPASLRAASSSSTFFFVSVSACSAVRARASRSTLVTCASSSLVLSSFSLPPGPGVAGCERSAPSVLAAPCVEPTDCSLLAVCSLPTICSVPDSALPLNFLERAWRSSSNFLAFSFCCSSRSLALCSLALALATASAASAASDSFCATWDSANCMLVTGSTSIAGGPYTLAGFILVTVTGQSGSFRAGAGV